MAGKTDYLENALLNHVFRNVAYTSPTTVYVGLFTSAPTDAGGGTEVSGGSYARKVGTFSAPSGGALSNSAAILFDVATANWGTIVAFGIFDAVSAGNLLYWNTMTSVTINTSEQLNVPIGDLDVTED